MSNPETPFIEQIERLRAEFRETIDTLRVDLDALGTHVPSMREDVDRVKARLNRLTSDHNDLTRDAVEALTKSTRLERIVIDPANEHNHDRLITRNYTLVVGTKEDVEKLETNNTSDPKASSTERIIVVAGGLAERFMLSQVWWRFIILMFLLLIALLIWRWDGVGPIRYESAPVERSDDTTQGSRPAREMEGP